MNEKKQWIFKLDKKCKHSRRYANEEKDSPVKQIYVKREFADGKDTITITLNGIKEV
jgi:hypothetical protein